MRIFNKRNTQIDLSLHFGKCDTELSIRVSRTRVTRSIRAPGGCYGGSNRRVTLSNNIIPIGRGRSVTSTWRYGNLRLLFYKSIPTLGYV